MLVKCVTRLTNTTRTRIYARPSPSPRNGEAGSSTTREDRHDNAPAPPTFRIRCICSRRTRRILSNVSTCTSINAFSRHRTSVSFLIYDLCEFVLLFVNSFYFPLSSLLSLSLSFFFFLFFICLFVSRYPLDIHALTLCRLSRRDSRRLISPHPQCDVSSWIG